MAFCIPGVPEVHGGAQIAQERPGREMDGAQ